MSCGEQAAHVSAVGVEGEESGVKTVRYEDLPASKEDIEAFKQLCYRLQDSRDQWQEDLVAMFAQEEDEDRRAKQIIRAALVNEASYCCDPAFARFRVSQEGQSHTTHEEKLRHWFHQDELLAHTPYAAVVPFPTKLSDASLRAVEEEIDGFGLQRPFLVESFVMHPSESASDANVGLRDSARQEFRTGADVRAAAQQHPLIQEALSQVPCLFLNDVATYDAQQRRMLAQGVVFVVGGQWVGLEVLLSGNLQPIDRNAKEEEVSAQVTRVEHAIRSLLATLMDQLAPCRNFIALFRVVASDGDSPTAEAFLLNLAPVEPRDYVLFSWDELFAAASSRRGSQVGAPHTIQVGFLSHGEVRRLDPAARRNVERWIPDHAPPATLPAGPITAPLGDTTAAPHPKNGPASIGGAHDPWVAAAAGALAASLTTVAVLSWLKRRGGN